jgi:hypothetical protein
MPEREQLYQALRNADAAGDTAAAKKLADYIKTLPQQQASPADQIPGSGNALAGNRNVGKPDESSFLDKVTGGIEAARSTVSGATTGALGYIGGALGGLAGSIATGEYGTQQGAQRVSEAAHDGAAKLTYQPQTDKGIEYTQNVAHAIDRSGIAGLPIGPELSAVGALAKPALPQVASALSTEAHIAKNLAQKASPANLVPTVDPAKAALAQKAIDMGITIPPHALSDNGFVRMAGEFLDNLPLSGSSKEANRDAFNRYLTSQIGGDTKAARLTPEVFAAAQRDAGNTIGETFRNIAVPASDAQFVSDLTDLVQAQGRELDPTRNLINGNVKELARIADDNGGAIPGSTLKKMHSEVLAKLRGNLDAYPGMREQLSDFQLILEDAAERQITDPAIKAAYDVARVQYAKSKTLEALVAKGGIDGVSPQALLGRVTATNQGKHRMATGAAGELGDAAQVAQQFMKEQPSSRSPERGFVIGAMTELAGAGKAAVGLTVGNIYNRFGPRMAQAMVERTLAQNKPQIAAPLSLADGGQFNYGPAFTREPQYNGLLHLADDTDPAYAVGGIAKDANPLRAPSGLVPDTERLATRHDVPTIDFPLRQEVLQQPDIAAAVDAFRAEDARLSKIAQNAISPKVRENAQQALGELRAEFANGMHQLGIDSAADAHGLNRPLIESGVPTRMPIQKTDRNPVPESSLRPPLDFQQGSVAAPTGLTLMRPEVADATATAAILEAGANRPAGQMAQPQMRIPVPAAFGRDPIANIANAKSIDEAIVAATRAVVGQ